MRESSSGVVGKQAETRASAAGKKASGYAFRLCVEKLLDVVLRSPWPAHCRQCDLGSLPLGLAGLSRLIAVSSPRAARRRVDNLPPPPPPAPPPSVHQTLVFLANSTT
ncbi:hypothetical protein Q1695_004651 [Nippostrongylus brasiliensis]|nr:hypothetical protein Q1695_004651 [Nippostrongylus brasiliensis]